MKYGSGCGQVGDPAYPRRVADFHRRLQHAVQRDEDRHLHQDRQAAAQRIDLLGLVQFHRGLVHLGRVALVALADGLHLRRHQLDLGHALVAGRRQREEGQLDQHREGDDGPAPVAQRAVDLFHDPEDGLGDDGQVAIVLDQHHARRGFFQQLRFLRARVQLGRVGHGGARRDRAQRLHGADGVDVRFDALGKDFAAQLILRHEGRHEEVLRDGDPAVVGLGRVVLHHGLAGFLGFVGGLAQRVELQRLVLAGIGVQGRAGEAAVEAGVGGRLVAVVLQLQVELRRDRLVAHVGDVVAHADDVVAALEGEGLGQLDAALGRFQHQLHLVAVGQRAHARQGGEAGGVVRQVGCADQAGLRQVDVVGFLVEQHLVLAGVDAVLELQQLQAHDGAAQGVDVGLHDVGGDGDALTLEGRCGAGDARGGGGDRAGAGGRHGGWRGRCLDQRRRSEHGRLASRHAPVIPQHEQ